MEVKDINNLSILEAATEFTRCCGSSRWVAEMIRRRPFRDPGELLAVSDEIWDSLSEDDWKEAFSHHPKIGDIESIRAKFADTEQWSSSEQSGVKAASDDTLHELKDLNDEYERKFGYIFIVFATGKTADQMLTLLRARLINDPSAEILMAKGEQKKIMQLRLHKLLAGEAAAAGK